ncbi:MAG: tRNA-intron lyase [Candidatus Hodarchaeota archaeon]
MEPNENNNSDEIEEEDLEKKKEFETVDALYEGGQVVIPVNKAEFFIEHGYYGTKQDDGSLTLDQVETVLLLERNRIKIFNKVGKEYQYEEMINKFIESNPDFWVNYLVYKDLRGRGYIVRPGFGEASAYRIYGRGAKVGVNPSKFVVSIITEGLSLNLMDLDKIVKAAKSIRKNLVLAVVDRQGEVTYYKCNAVDL